MMCIITLHIPLPQINRFYHIIVLRILLSLLFHNELYSFKIYIFYHSLTLYSRWKQVFQRYKQVFCLFFEIAHKHTIGGSKLPHKTYFRGVFILPFPNICPQKPPFCGFSNLIYIVHFFPL